MTDPKSSGSTASWLAPLIRALDWLGRRLAALWRVIHTVLLLLKPGRFSLIMVLAGLLFLFVSDQGLDTLRDFAERKAGARHDLSQTLAFWVGGFLWAYGSWYWARIMYFIRLSEPLPDHWFVRGAQLWIPRIIGAAAIFGLAVAFHKAAAPYPDELHSPGRILERYAWYSLGGGLVFLLFVILRRPLAPTMTPLVQHLPFGGLVAEPLRQLKPVAAVKQEFGTRAVREVLWESRWQLGLTLLTAVVLFALFAVSPEWFGPRFGSTPIMLLAAAGWIAFGSAADLFAMVNRFPVWITLLLAALASSVVNDNHAVRTLAGGTPPDWARRATVEQALKDWQTRQLARPLAGRDDKYPLFVVAAEGGGIRAAYWTASVLGEIQDRNPCFADQLFALSGVSGGSLGSAVFAALLTDSRYHAPNFRCDDPAAPRLQPTAQAVLGEDFLAPAIAATLYPDLLQRILPVPVAHFDRARALETAWERAWQRHAELQGFARHTRFADGFDTLWRDQTDHWMPALLLNSTVVESGKRLIISNLRLTAEEFADVEDAHRFYDERTLSLSTAVHLSARFTYVSPAGTLEKGGRVYGRAVDGGYFENSGATTALEVLKTVNQLQGACGKQPNCFWAKVEPVLILISNEPVDPRYQDVNLGTDPQNRDQAGRPTACCNEVWSPLRTLLATRGARGAYARETSRWHVGGSHFLHFGLCRDGEAKIPLGWTLSEVVRRTMDEQLRHGDTAGCQVFDNPGNLRRIEALLAKRTRPRR